MPDYSIALFSYNKDQENLVSILSDIKKYVFGQFETILVWDDYANWKPIDFDQIKKDSDFDFRVIKQSEIYDWPESIIRWGWLKQQLAKLLCYTYSRTDYTWICDGDLRLQGPIELFSPNGKPYLRFTNDPIRPHDGYYKFMKDFLGINEPYPTIIANGGGTCVFDHYIVKSLFDDCLKRNNCTLADCINSIIHPDGPDSNTSNLFPFSEFETYGNYALINYPDRFEKGEENWQEEKKEKKSYLTHPIVVL